MARMKARQPTKQPNKQRGSRKPQNTRNVQNVQNVQLSHEVEKAPVLKFKFTPKTSNQNIAYQAWKEGKHLFLDGNAGVGKTYLALAFALQTVLDPDTPQTKVMIVRSLVPSRDIGFLKGGAKEKGEKYENPYIGIVGEIFNNPSAYGYLVSKGIIQFESTSFQRGNSLHETVVICDEIQNYEWNEFNTMFTRIGRDSRLIAAGDGRQDDISSERYHRESSFNKACKVVDYMDAEFSHITFGIGDIVRSGFVKSYMIACDELGF